MLTSLEPTTTRAAALALIRRALVEAGLESPALDARLLLAAALGVGPVELVARPGAALGPEGAARLAALVRRRLAREPVARILGEREFWGLPFELSAETLVPRPDSETVVKTALALVPDTRAPLRILDLGTGSGCLLTALLHERPTATGFGLDRSPGALRAARRNAVRNGVGERALFVASDWASAIDGRFDLVVSNPPYIASPALETLDPEVRWHDPVAALDGGPDGLDAFRAILREADRLLGPQGVMVLEIGFHQSDAVHGLAARSGLAPLETARDLSGHSRAVAIKRSSSSR